MSSAARQTAASADLPTEVMRTLREVPDFPRAGIVFRDITPLLASPRLFARCITAMSDPFAQAGVTHVAAIESRGFFFGAPIAQRLGVGLVPIRKPGKLPYHRERHEYALEYGTDALEVHSDACDDRATVLVVDDVLATGGTAAAAAVLLTRLGARVAGYSFLLEIAGLAGRAALGDTRIVTVAQG